MGQEIASGIFTRDDRSRYRRKVRRCLDVFALMLDDFRFDADRPMTGLELELNLVDAAAEPAMRNAEVLVRPRRPSFQTELGLFNMELNARPRTDRRPRLRRLRADIAAQLARADGAARKSDATLVLSASCPP